MNKSQFLQQSDVNLLDYEVSETLDQKGIRSIDVLISVKGTDESVLLTKENLQHLISEIENAEVNGIEFED